MIEKLDIANFGSFTEFRWDTDVRESHGAVGRFKKLNILYGRNYSGKTTLSRIFRSFEIGHRCNASKRCASCCKERQIERVSPQEWFEFCCLERCVIPKNRLE